MATYLIELHYLPGAAFLAPLAAGWDLQIEQMDHFQKKTGRNRCRLLSSYGMIQLSIPLLKGKHQQQPYRDVRIARDSPWERTHWRTIQSCYGRSPFFEHYADTLASLYENREKFLWDWNMKLFHWVLEQLHIPASFALSTAWNPTPESDIHDFRGAIHPSDQGLVKEVVYPQVFTDRHGFTGDLSVLDLLFCAGPQARMILRGMTRPTPA